MKLLTLRRQILTKKEVTYQTRAGTINVVGIGRSGTQWGACHLENGRWNVTHVPSGLRVGPASLKKAHAVELLFWLEKADIPRFKTGECAEADLVHHIKTAVVRNW